MKLFFDFLPVILFFAVYKLGGNDIYRATLVAIVTSVLQVGYVRLRHRKVERVQLIGLVMIVVFGSATLLLRNERFIMWKPTVLNAVLALVFLASHHVARKKPLLQTMMEQAIELPDAVWRRMSYAWMAFFLVSGTLNIIVAYACSQNTWVNFRMFGLLGLTVLFAIGQAVYLARYLAPNTAPDGDAS